jgi:hypothetical protein
MTSTLDRESGQPHPPRPRFTLGNRPRYPLDREDGWVSELVSTQKVEERSFASVGDRTLVVQSVVRHCTDLDIPAP